MNKFVICPQPECGNKIIVPDDAQVGQIITCTDQFSDSKQGCLTEYEIISTDPLQIILLEEEK